MDRHAAISLLLTGAALLASASLPGCRGVNFATRGMAPLFEHEAKVPGKDAARPHDDARLAVTWIGHATVLLQIDDRFILTDPVLTDTVGEASKRLVEPGMTPESLPPIDDVVISHLHFDHYSFGSIDALAEQAKVRHLFLPDGGLVYAPDWDFPVEELPTWRAVDDRGVVITAVPVRHVGWRYGIDRAWMTRSFTGYVLQYHGLSVYFGGDTGYERPSFEAAQRRFGRFDVALLPIAPIEPRAFMEHNHMDPREALSAMEDLHADRMVPIHFDTFINSFDAVGDAPRILEEDARRRGLDARVARLAVGERRVLVAR